jgi:hypothetical protein
MQVAITFIMTHSLSAAPLVHIQYGKAGKLTMGEARKLHAITREILRHLGYSDQEISERLKNTTVVSPKGRRS